MKTWKCELVMKWPGSDNDDLGNRQAATIAAELLRGGTSPTAEALVVPQVAFFCHFQLHQIALRELQSYNL